MKKIFISLFALLIGASAFGQTYPSPTYGSITLQNPLAITSGGVGASTAAGARTNLGLGTIATQNASAVSITGGTVSGTSISGGTITGGTVSGASISGGTITGLSSPLPIASGGTNSATALGATTNLQFQASGTGAATRTVASKLGDIVSVGDYGALCAGADETTNFANALNSFGTNGGALLLPAGTCVVSSLSVPTNVTVMGRGPSSTTLATNSATANLITFTGTGCGVRDLQFASTVTRTGGAYVTSQYGFIAQNLNLAGHFVGFNIAGASPAALAVNPTLTNINMFSPAVGAGSAAMIFENYSNAVVKGVVASGTASGQQPDYGLVFKNGDTAFVSDTNVTRNGYALAIIPGSGENNYSFNASNSDFDSAGLVSGSVNASSCLIQPTSNGNVYESHFTNVWCGLALGDGALIGSSGTGVIDGMHWSGGIFDGNGGSGFHITSNVQNWSAVGGHAAGNTGSGYYVSAASNDWNLLGVRAGPVSNRGSNGAAGVNVGVNASNNYTIIADTSGNTGGTTSNSGTGAVQTVINNGALTVTQAIKPSSTAGITGTSTNDSANAGAVGEYPTPTNLTSVSLTSGTAANGASVSLTAGDWDVSGTCQFVPAGSTTISSVIVGVNTVSATLPGAPNEVAIQATLTTGAQQIVSTPPARITLAGTTTVYTVCQSGFGTSTMTANGFIRARRPR
ncbi:outer membrane autotransporter [Burkholderia contaminans]|uniref:beta strand repeat-containing protein n=1 Tax=Burkholderia contaminans TaxID=488447 RepID=UPI0014544FFC|nr:hypothetical protein [Burkholderia contaminans]VWC75770.1 outer membrane autotransporter [Burkholderia contaminans]